MKLADKIRILRKARGLSQEQLGYSLSRVNKDGISRQTVSDWENGKFEPKLENIRDLAEVLNVSFDALLDESIDLEDDKALYSVLNGEKKQGKTKIDNSFSYYLYAYNVSKRDIFRLVLAIVADIIMVASIIIIINSLTNNSFEWYTFVAFVGAGASVGVGIPYTIMIPKTIKSIIHGESSVYFGTLTNSYLHLSTYKTASNSIYIPIEKIEKIEISGKANKYHGPVDIFIKERNKPVHLIDIKEPQKFIDVFNSLDSYIENPDEVKIL
jgi:transcriptional regulator with XRE-family HTH domain